jgi:hypothetical protein
MRRRPLSTETHSERPFTAEKPWRHGRFEARTLDPPRSATLDPMLITVATAIIPLDSIALPEMRA